MKPVLIYIWDTSQMSIGFIMCFLIPNTRGYSYIYGYSRNKSSAITIQSRRVALGDEIIRETIHV